MSDVTNIFNRLTNLEVAPQFDAYSKVIIHVSDDTTYEVGDNSGRTLEIDNPFGTQAMAQAILNSLRGFQYQPYTADGALLDPAAEIGDGANMRGNYGGIYTRDRNFGRLMKADISAPHDEEINHEYAYESPETREFKRSINDVKASLIIANDRIDAKVSQTGGTNANFGWSLTSTAHTWYANGQEVMKVSKAGGLEVRGKVTATSGTIGGFDINAEDLRFNNLNYGDTDKNYGVYIGKRGIQLGKAFMVSNSGYVAADSMTLTGTLTIGGQQITASSLRSGAQSAYNWSTNGTSNYWSGGAGYGYSYNAATQTSATNYPSYFTCGILRLMNGNIRIGNKILGLQTKTISGVTINYLGY